MSYEAALVTLIAPVLGGRFTPDIPREPVVYPCGVYQQIGGQSLWFSEGAMPDHKHARVQITVWSETRAQTMQLIRQIEDSMCTSFPNSESYGAPVATYEDAIKKYGARLDVGFWYRDP